MRVRAVATVCSVTKSTAAISRFVRCLHGSGERETRNPRLYRQQMTSGQVWRVGRWSEVMLDQLLRSLSG